MPRFALQTFCWGWLGGLPSLLFAQVCPHIIWNCSLRLTLRTCERVLSCVFKMLSCYLFVWQLSVLGRTSRLAAVEPMFGARFAKVWHMGRGLCLYSFSPEVFRVAMIQLELRIANTLFAHRVVRVPNAAIAMALLELPHAFGVINGTLSKLHGGAQVPNQQRRRFGCR